MWQREDSKYSEFHVLEWGKVQFIQENANFAYILKEKLSLNDYQVMHCTQKVKCHVLWHYSKYSLMIVMNSLVWIRNKNGS